MVDAYRQPYIPFYLTTREFFELARGAAGAGRDRRSSTSATPRAATSSSGCSGGRWRRPSRASCATRSSRPTRCWSAATASFSAARLRRNAAALPAALRPLAREAAAALAPRLPGGEVYTDDRAPVEWLVDSSLLEYANE